jgi:large conductance mechanosensitive channel
MSMLKEFKEFAMKGNVVDLAVWVVIGAAFGKIVTSLVEDLMMPLIGWIFGKVDFSQLTLPLPAMMGDPVVLKYGVFLTVLVNFLIVAFAIFFFVVKPINKMKKPAPAAWPSDNDLLAEIRDLLKKGK